MLDFLRFRKKELEESASTTGTAYFGYVSNANLTDAKAYASAWLEKYTESPGMAGVYLHKYGSGYLFEIQERGIGKKAWLPSILKVWDQQKESGDNQSITLVLDRIVQGQRQGERISFVLLPEGSYELETTPGLAADGPNLISFRPDYTTVDRLIKGLVGGSLLILFISLSFKAFMPDETTTKTKTIPPVAVFRLPIAQWPTLMNAVNRGGYVTALRYKDQTWQEQTVSPGLKVQPKKATKIPGHPKQIKRTKGPAQ